MASTGGGGSGIYTPNSSTSGYSSSSPGSWAGQKMTQNEESSVTQFSGQQFPRVHRGIESSFFQLRKLLALQQLPPPSPPEHRSLPPTETSPSYEETGERRRYRGVR